MHAATKSPLRGHTIQDLLATDDEWRALVAEAAAAAGLNHLAHLDHGPFPPVAPRVPDFWVDEVGPSEPAQLRQGDVRAVIKGGRADPEFPQVAASAPTGADRPTVFKASSHVRASQREMGMTCQIGQFSSDAGGRYVFPAENVCNLGSFNVAEAEIVASVSASELHKAACASARSTVYIPVAFDNTIQRVSRLAVPSADMLRDPTAPHFAVVGLRGVVSLTVEGTGIAPVVGTRHFLSRTLSAHAPERHWGFGPLKGPHCVEVDIPSLVPAQDVTVTVKVSLLSLLAGDVHSYERRAPFYAGIDFDGRGTAELPGGGSCFAIPLTPLLGNKPITVPEISLTGCW